MVIGDTETFTVGLEDSLSAVPLVQGDTVYFTAKQGGNKIQKVVTSFTNGQAIFTLEPRETKSKPLGDYKYDVQVTFKDGTIKTIVHGKTFTLLEEITYD